jgi:hypothetical protein
MKNIISFVAALFFAASAIGQSTVTTTRAANPAAGCTAGQACTGTTITATTGFVGPYFAESNNRYFLGAAFGGLTLNSAGGVIFTNSSVYTGTQDLFLTRYAAKQLMISGDGTGTASGQVGLIIGNNSSFPTYGVIHASSAPPSSTNYSFATNGGQTILNAPTSTLLLSRADSAVLTIANTAGSGPSITAGTAQSVVNALNITQTRNYSGAATDYIKATFTTSGGGTATNASDNLLNLLTGASGAETSKFSVRVDGVVTSAQLMSAGGGGFQAVANQGYFYWLGSTEMYAASNGKLKIGNSGSTKSIELRAIVPTIGTCGTSPSVAGTDTAMTVTVGTGGVATACGVTFSGAYTNAPACTAQSDTDVAALSVATTTTTLTVTKATAFTASSKLHIHCIGYV